MADLYAVSVDLSDGTARTYFYDRGLAESMIKQGYRVATQAEIDKKVAGLATDPALGYYRQVLSWHVPTPAETAAKVAGAKRDMGGWVDRYNVAAARAQPFLEKVGASSGNLVTGELVGNRKLTQQEMWNWQGMVAEINKAAGQAQWYAAEAGLSEYPDRGRAAIRSGTAVSQDKAAWKTQEVEPLVWAHFRSPDGKNKVTAYEGSAQYRTLVGMGWKVTSTQVKDAAVAPSTTAHLLPTGKNRVQQLDKDESHSHRSRESDSSVGSFLSSNMGQVVKAPEPSSEQLLEAANGMVVTPEKPISRASTEVKRIASGMRSRSYRPPTPRVPGGSFLKV
jgi:hypothetical protein